MYPRRPMMKPRSLPEAGEWAVAGRDIGEASERRYDLRRSSDDSLLWRTLASVRFGFLLVNARHTFEILKPILSCTLFVLPTHASVGHVYNYFAPLLCIAEVVLQGQIIMNVALMYFRVLVGLDIFVFASRYR